jgi:competence ComEA-like helix-hairpin-helix protein
MKKNERSRFGTQRLALAVLLGAFVVGFGASASAVTIGVVNINTASVEELQLLPGIGRQRAAAILAARKARGGFKKAEELVEVKGIGKVMFEHMRDNVTLKGSTTARRVRRGGGAKADSE